MLTKAEVKLISQLISSRRARYEHHLFVAEGPKLVDDMMSTFECKILIATDMIIKEVQRSERANSVRIVPHDYDFRRISSLVRPQSVVGLFAMPINQELTLMSSTDLSLMLDCVQDPGNMGTIIRTADWFGIKEIYLTEGCVDPYSPKVVQATMGSLCRVRLIHVSDPIHLLRGWQGMTYGTYPEGKSLYCPDLKQDNDRPVLLVMGNEGNGISSNIAQELRGSLSIPRYGADGSESLNVAIATAVCVAELRRIYNDNK